MSDLFHEVEMLDKLYRIGEQHFRMSKHLDINTDEGLYTILNGLDEAGCDI